MPFLARYLISLIAFGTEMTFLATTLAGQLAFELCKAYCFALLIICSCYLFVVQSFIVLILIVIVFLIDFVVRQHVSCLPSPFISNPYFLWSRCCSKR
jgi:hypothetical protein